VMGQIREETTTGRFKRIAYGQTRQIHALIGQI
jgi:hypothetical protein